MLVAPIPPDRVPGRSGSGTCFKGEGWYTLRIGRYPHVAR
jgi:hypothetical protein